MGNFLGSHLPTPSPSTRKNKRIKQRSKPESRLKRASIEEGNPLLCYQLVYESSRVLGTAVPKRGKGCPTFSLSRRKREIELLRSPALALLGIEPYVGLWENASEKLDGVRQQYESSECHQATSTSSPCEMLKRLGNSMKQMGLEMSG